MLGQYHTPGDIRNASTAQPGWHARSKRLSQCSILRYVSPGSCVAGNQTLLSVPGHTWRKPRSNAFSQLSVRFVPLIQLWQLISAKWGSPDRKEGVDQADRLVGAYAMSVPDIWEHALSSYRTSRTIRYVSTGHLVPHAISVPGI
eukprot:1853318-Rhodomonas_salina.2